MDKQRRLISGNNSFERAYMLWKKELLCQAFFFLNKVRPYVFFLFIIQAGEN